MFQAKCLFGADAYVISTEATRIQALILLGAALNLQHWIVEETIADGTSADTVRAWCSGTTHRHGLVEPGRE